MNKKDNLKKHIEARHFPNVFSYQCSECSFVVGNKKALNNHIRLKHPKLWINFTKYLNIFSFKGDRENLEQYILSAEDGTYICGICNQALKRRDNILRHIESKHFPNLFTYQCNECPLTFGSKSALYTHKHKHRVLDKNWNTNQIHHFVFSIFNFRCHIEVGGFWAVSG